MYAAFFSFVFWRCGLLILFIVIIVIIIIITQAWKLALAGSMGE